MQRKPLPQFNSIDEAVAYYHNPEKRGVLEFIGRAGTNYEYCVYNYHVKDGRLLYINIYNNGKVEYRR